MKKIIILQIFLILKSKPQIPCTPDSKFKSLTTKYKYFKSLTIPTQDNYLLKIFRVRNTEKKNKKSIILIHGIIDSSDNWLINKKSSIAKTLLNQGYDLWFLNSRGNKYSCYHKNLKNDDKNFWDFSFQEMGLDLKAVVEHVFFETKEKVLVFGHSQGSSQVFAKLSTDLELQGKIEKFFAFAPVVYFIGLISENQKNLFSFLNNRNFFSFLRFFHVYRIGEKGFIKTKLGENILALFCKLYTFLCNWLLDFFIGNPKLDDIDQISKFLAHAPSRSSLRSFEHYYQLIINNDLGFRHFDFGEKRNLLEYNSKNSPIFDISKINIPVYIYYSDNDELSTIESVRLISKKLKNAKFRFFEGFSHLTYFWGKDLRNLSSIVLRDVEE